MGRAAGGDVTGESGQTYFDVVRSMSRDPAVLDAVERAEKAEASLWRDGWLEGRAVSLRLIRQEVSYMRVVSREAVLELADAMLAGVAQDRERKVEAWSEHGSSAR
jgi:hypothetical protein